MMCNINYAEMLHKLCRMHYLMHAESFIILHSKIFNIDSNKHIYV